MGSAGAVRGARVGARLGLAALALASAALLALLAAAAPAYSSQNFDVYDLAGAGPDYARSVADALERALSTLLQAGAGLAPPCAGSRYPVYVSALSGGEGGYVSWRYEYDPPTGRVVSACVSNITIAAGLASQQLGRVALHEMIHVSQASYYRYAAVAASYPWYVEASAEGVTGALLGSCGWEPEYFRRGLYSVDPYSYRGSAQECYALGAFYHWVVSSGYASVPGALSNSLSGSTEYSGWVASAYADFLLAIARGVQMCGSYLAPGYQQVQLGTSGWRAQVTLQGLSAAYYRLVLPAPGYVVISASGVPRSNLVLGRPFYAPNTTLILALVNPGASPATYEVSALYSPPLRVEVKGGLFRPLNGTLQLRLYVTYGAPVSGTVVVNGTPVEASSGLAAVELSGVSWGSYALVVEYAGERAVVRLGLSRPQASLVTQTPLYLTPRGHGSLVLSVINPNAVELELALDARLPAAPGGSALELEGLPRLVALRPGASSVSVGFRARDVSRGSSGSLVLRLGPGEELAVPFSVEPADIEVVGASYDSRENSTAVDVLVRPPMVRARVRVEGLSGEAPVPLSTYYVGYASVRVPPYLVRLAASPLLVAPGWALVNASAAVSAAGTCPAYPVRYGVAVSVNGTPLGVASFACGGGAVLRGLLNVTVGPRGGRLTLAVDGAPQWSVGLEVVPPRIEVRLAEWRVTDGGSLVSLTVAVSGPHRYLVLGRVVANGTLELERRLPPGESALTLDAGFERAVVPMPEVRISLRVPEVALYPGPVRVEITVNTSAVLNASLALELGGRPVGALRVAGRGLVGASAELQPPEPGAYTVAVRSWFGGAEGRVLCARVRGVLVQAPPLALVGSRARVSVLVLADPPLPLPVNVTLRGCESGELRVEGNATLELSYREPCTLAVEARLLNLSGSASVRWDKLNLHLEGVLGRVGGQPVVPSGLVRGYAVFSNGTRVPAPVLVNGVEAYATSELGGRLLTLSVEYLGCRNSTTVGAFLVPRELYVEAVEALGELGHPRHLRAQLEAAVATGRWGALTEALEALREARGRAARYDPLGHLALWLVRRWAEEGGSTELAAARWLLANEHWLYLSAAALLSYALLRRRRDSAA